MFLANWSGDRASSRILPMATSFQVSLDLVEVLSCGLKVLLSSSDACDTSTEREATCWDCLVRLKNSPKRPAHCSRSQSSISAYLQNVFKALFRLCRRISSIRLKMLTEST